MINMIICQAIVIGMFGIIVVLLERISLRSEWRTDALAG
jgi:hypothetical protein